MSENPYDEIMHWTDDLRPDDPLSGVEAQLREIAKAAKAQAEAAEKAAKTAKTEKWISLVCTVISVLIAAIDLLFHFVFRG